MRFHGFARVVSAAALGAGLLALPAATLAQAPAGPLPAESPQPSASSPAARQQAPAPEVQPRSSILGAWKLNPDESDDPRKKMQDARRSGGGGNRGGGIRMGVPGMGGGPYGGRRGGGQNGEDEQERERMQAIVAPPNSVTLSRKEAEVDLMDDQNRKTTFFTDGRKLEKSKDATNQQAAAHWDGNRLVTDEKNPRGGKMSRTYELSYDGKQLYETVELNMGRSNSPVSIRYVFDQAGAQQAQAKQ